VARFWIGPRSTECLTRQLHSVFWRAIGRAFLSGTQFSEGQQSAQDARVDQCVDLGVHILHFRIRQHGRGGVHGEFQILEHFFGSRELWSAQPAATNSAERESIIARARRFRAVWWTRHRATRSNWKQQAATRVRSARSSCISRSPIRTPPRGPASRSARRRNRTHTVHWHVFTPEVSPLTRPPRPLARADPPTTPFRRFPPSFADTNPRRRHSETTPRQKLAHS
jgi:hypothetical protein